MACMTALCRCAVGNVGLNVGIDKVESHITQQRVERLSVNFVGSYTGKSPRDDTCQNWNRKWNSDARGIVSHFVFGAYLFPGSR